MKPYLLFILLLSSMLSGAQVHWISYQPPPIQGNTVTQAYEIGIDTAGNIWQVVDDLFSSWLLKFDGTYWTIPDSNYLPSYSSTDITFDRNNSIWSGSGSQIVKWNNGAKTFYNVPGAISNKWHAHFKCDANDKIWFVSFNYISRFDGSIFTVYDSSITGIPSGEYFNDMMVSNNNHIYASTDSSGIFEFDGTSWQVISSTNSNLPPNVSIHGITADSIGNLYALGYWKNSNNIFFASYKNGTFNYFTLPYEFHPYGYDMMIDSNNNVFYYGDQYKLIKYNGSFFTTYSQPYPFADCFWSRIDKKGNIWISGNGAWLSCLLRFDPNGFQTVQGIVYDDQNQNGAQDVNEAGIKAEMINSSLSNYAVTDSNGFFAIPYVDSNQTFTLAHQLKQYRIQSSLPLTYSITPSSGVTNNYDFGIYTLPNITDMEVYSYLSKTKSGLPTSMFISYYNAGTVSCSDTIILTYDTQLQFQYASLTPVLQSPGLLKFVYPLVQPNGYGNIYLSFMVDSNAIIGDTVHTVTSIKPIQNDSIPYNNVWEEDSEIKNSWDPNSKEVNSATSAIDPDQELIYTINFQNTGNDTAFTIFITDTLDGNLNIGSIKILGSSHPYLFEIISSNILRFTFSKIMLVDSFTNELLSHGFIRYSIKPKQGLTTGASISNTANIYFDYNPAIITNTTYNYVPIATIENNTKPNLKFHPNPAQNYFSIELPTSINSQLEIQLFSIDGKQILNEKRTPSSSIKIDSSKLNAGLYLIKIIQGNNIYFGKVSIIK